MNRANTREKSKINEIEKLITTYGQVDGDHHKLWVIDQIMRIIKQDKYYEFVEKYEHSDDEGYLHEEKIYLWDTGIAP